LRMPGMGGIEATSRIMHNFPKLKILAVTSCEDEPFPSRLLQAGAMGYLTKGAGKDEMVKSIRLVMSGQRYVSPDIAQKMALRPFAYGEDSPFDELSERELQVAIMITDGTKVQEISDRLHLSRKTVNSYRYRIFEKLGVSSDVELTLLALRYGLLDNPEQN
jgi:two-component system, NarL family, invasion response regulator UvrY